uniref:Integrase catalytic domain-containing protein n=1 Tax=Chromera velia CCMP2878 TaxID=1169474 RepID=A0A0K6S6D7_9ALVE|eukprot:Cvel_3177.t2-p1 / transcript=Cvel_3177.t2 / gene=Cvel_3177 / organism=Chromera_velia_CCMP2878 / gene_product=hypothetical protein / transcript_product=hypothetical protein / location=Cvel_scaffold124:3521-4900(-) / protein_length=303 / sequence_SO=supercontig / SO=protein_coding / is_pseudo=false
MFPRWSRMMPAQRLIGRARRRRTLICETFVALYIASLYVDAPNGHCCSRIPSFPLPVNTKKREAEFDREWGGGRQALCMQCKLRCLDIEEARVEHDRLGIHSEAEYFRLTLEEDGKSITAAMAVEITATCWTCQQKQAVNKLLTAATWEKSRRSKVKEFGDEVYLDMWFPGDKDTEVSGFPYGNLWTDLHTCSKFNTPMRSRRDATDSLMDWIDYYGIVPKKILTDRAPKLIGGKFIETCRSFSLPILLERAPTGIKRILGFTERPIRTHWNQVSGQNLPAAYPQGGGALPQIGAIQEGATAA